MNILEKIIANKRVEIIRQQEAFPISMLESLIEERKEKKSVSLKQSLINSSTGIIAEFKRKSPSKDWIFEKAQVEVIIPGYEKAGASGISVLTDELYFGGNLRDLKIARELTEIPLLRKDFVIDEYQMYQAKAIGADVVLLIAAALTKKQSKELASLAKRLGLEVLLEIHAEQELDYIHSNVDLVGVNNRNLTTFVTDIQCSLDLVDQIPGEFVKISESGISDPAVVTKLRQAGFQGFLMGENFMKTEDPGQTLNDFIQSI